MTISQGVVHKVPKDVKDALNSQAKTIPLWNALTPIARNEWLCWIMYVQKEETRKSHIKRLIEDLSKGKKRPCCWAGCPHRNQNAAKYFKKPPKWMDL